MTIFGQRSVAPALKLFLDALWYLLWFVLALISLLVVVTAAAFIMELIGQPFPGYDELDQPLNLFARALPVMVAEIAVLMVVIDRLRRIFATLVSGDPFVPENAGHLRVIAAAIIVYQVLGHAIQGAFALTLTMLGSPVSGGGEWSVAPDVQVGSWLAAIALLVFAEVFREGARMRQEQKLTI